MVVGVGELEWYWLSGLVVVRSTSSESIGTIGLEILVLIQPPLTLFLVERYAEYTVEEGGIYQSRG